MGDERDTFFSDVLAPVGAHAHSTTTLDVAPGDDDWFEHAARDELSAEGSAAAASAVGAAALSPDHAAVRRAPRHRRARRVRTKGRRPSHAARALLASGAVVVVVCVAAVLVSPAQSPTSRDQPRVAAGAPPRAPSVARPAPQRTRPTRPSTRPVRTRPAKRQVSRRAGGARHASPARRPRPRVQQRASVAPAVAAQRRSAVSAQPRPARAPSSSSTPGDLPPATWP
jgi:hypothetical protein